MNDLTITNEYLTNLFRKSKNGPVNEIKKNHQKLVAAFKTGVDEAAGMGCWALDMLEELNTMRDKQTGNARVCPPEVQPHLDKALAQARADKAIKGRSTLQTLQTTEA